MSPTPGHRCGWRTHLSIALAIVVLSQLLANDSAHGDEETLVRVTAEQADVHTGPAFSYRTVYLAGRDEVFPVIERATHTHWFRVRLPDGTSGWIFGDQVFPVDIDTADANREPSLWRRIGDAIFSPSPLLEGTFGMSFAAGVLGGDPAVFWRPSWLLAPHLALEGFVGEAVGNQIDVVYYGAGPNIFLFPSSPLTPFLGAAGGGAWARPKADQFAIRDATYATVNVGGGLLIAFKKRVTVRGDARHYVVFSPNHTQRITELTGALSIVF